MQLESSLRDGALVITAIMQRLDAAVAIQFKDEMRTTAFDGPAQVVLDLAQVEFLDSSGLGALVATLKALAPDQKLELANLSPIVEKVFRLTRMDSVFTIHQKIEAAFDGDDNAATL